MAAAKSCHMMTGPGVETRVPEGPHVALSIAITFACSASRRKVFDVTYYVRDPKGNAIGYATVESDGTVTVRGIQVASG